MPRQKRKSRIVEYSEQRLAVMESINIPQWENDLSIPIIQNSIDKTRTKLKEYNAALSIVDQLSGEVNELEKSLIALNDRMLSSIAVRYGHTSAEYKRVRSIRRNPTKKKATPPAEAVATPSA
jgi:hypothetical protein